MKFIIILTGILLVFSCQQVADNNHSQIAKEIEMHEMAYGFEDQTVEIIPPNTAEPPPPPAMPETSTETIDEKIIKNGYIQIEVNEIRNGKKHMDLLVKSMHAYYENEEYHHSDYQSSYQLNIRIPSDHFESFIDAIESGEGNITSKNISSRNVTEQFLDLEIRQKNKEAYLSQYHELLKKTGSVKELLEVQERIRRISEEIEATKGRLRYLADQVGYSTLHITLTQHHDQVLAKSPLNIGERLKNALRSGLETGISFLIGAVSFWPVILIILIFLYFRNKIFTPFRFG